jgi:CRISPR system Cascade subunit CasA
VLAHCVVEDPEDTEEWRDLWNVGRFPEERIKNYLNQWNNRFDLFHPEFPFFQVGGFHLIGKDGKPSDPAPVTLLAQELACANNATLFDHSRDDQVTARTPAWCARKLVTTQAWGLFGGKGPTSNLGAHEYSFMAPLVGGLQVFIIRNNLFETLMANLLCQELRPKPFLNLGTPLWELGQASLPSSEPVVPTGYLEALTMPPRFLRLLPQETQEGILVRELYSAPGRKLDRSFDDPFQVRRLSAKKDTIYPITLDPERAIWRNGGALFRWHDQQEGPGDNELRPANLRQACSDEVYEALAQEEVLQVSIFGLANDKAKPLFWSREDLPCAVQLLKDQELAKYLHRSLGEIEAGGTALWSSLGSLAHEALTTEQKKPDPKDEKRIQQRLYRSCGFWSQVERGFLPFMQELPRNPEEARRRWNKRMVETAKTCFDRATSQLPGTSARRLRAHARTRPKLSHRLAKITIRKEESP